MRSVVSSLIVLLSFGTAGPTDAKSAMPESGSRVRVTALNHKRWIGSFIAVAHDTVTMRDGDVKGALVAIPVLQVVRFEISRGIRPNGLRVAGEGFAAGALFGAVAGYASYSDNSSSSLFLSSAGVNAAAAAIGFGVLGATVGAARGALTHSERWRTLKLNDIGDAVRH